MLLRVAVFLMMALGLVGFATVAWFSLQPPQSASANDELQKERILVASHDLRPGALLKPDDITVQAIAQEKVPEGASPDTPVARHAMTGAMVRRPMSGGEVVLPHDILRPVERGFLAAVLGAGMRAVTVGVDAITGTAGLIWPGDHVDVMLTQTIEDATRPLGKRIAAETVLTDVRVIAIDQQLAQGATPGATENKQATTVTVEVNPGQAERVQVATRLGRLSLVVRSASTEPVASADAAPAPAITWASDVSPALASEVTTASPNVVHVFSGAADGKEHLMRAIFIALVAALMLVPAGADGQRPSAPRPAPVEETQASLVVEVGSGRVVPLPAPVANVFVSDPKIAEVRPASPTSLFLFGVTAGRTTVAALNAAGGIIRQYVVTVRPSVFGATEAAGSINHAVPGANVRLEAQPKRLVLRGRVATPADADIATTTAAAYLADGQSLENRLHVNSQIQVGLRVRIAEMSRNVTRALGVNWTALGDIGKIAVNFSTANPIAQAAGAATGILASSYNSGNTHINNLIDALAGDNLIHVLAEPNLVAMSGESASFLVGGEFPIPVSQQNGSISVDFKQFGIALAFVPTVLSEDRIRLHVSPEVSQLSTTGAVTISSIGGTSINIPALTVRRAETTVELGSGQSFAIAGLLQDTTTQTVSALPGLGEVPILGALFRSDSFLRQQTELVIIVTPYIMRPVNDPTALKLPTDGFRPPNDIERILLLRQTGIGTAEAGGRIPGQAGFVVE